MKKSIVPDFSLLLHIEFDVDDVNPICGSVWVSTGNSYIAGVSVDLNAQGYYKNGHNHYYIYPQYYAVYISSDYDKFQFWLNPNPDPTLQENQQVVFYNVEIYQTDNYDNISGSNVKQLFRVY